MQVHRREPELDARDARVEEKLDAMMGVLSEKLDFIPKLMRQLFASCAPLLCACLGVQRRSPQLPSTKLQAVVTPPWRFGRGGRPRGSRGTDRGAGNEAWASAHAVDQAWASSGKP